MTKQLTVSLSSHLHPRTNIFIYVYLKGYLLKIHLKNTCFYLFIWQCQVLGEVCEIFMVARAIFLFVAHELLLEACGIQLPEQGLNPGPCIWRMESQPLDHQGQPPRINLSTWNTSVKKQKFSTLLVFTFQRRETYNKAGDTIDNVLQLILEQRRDQAC